MELKDLVGKHKLEAVAINIRHPFTDDVEGIAWAMDDKVYFVFEDRNDGYSSQAAPILVGNGPAYDFWDPDYIQRDIVCRHVDKGDYQEDSDIIEMVDVETGHIWMRVGTENLDDYYPWFVCNFTPSNLPRILPKT